MPGEPQCISPTAGSHGYGGPPAPSLKYPRRSNLLHSPVVAHDKYKGIRFRPELGRYISEIRPAQPRKRKIWLGTYKTAEEAARAFDAGIFYTKKSTTYNFEDSPSILEPLPENLSPEEEHVEIQKKAKAAAARAQPADAQKSESRSDQDDATAKLFVVTKAHNPYAPHHRHSYAHHHQYSHDLGVMGGGEPFYQRHEIPREIQFAVLTDR